MTGTNVSVLPVYGVDPDRTQTTDLVTVVRRRIEGRYPVDAFGADPQLQDLIAPFVTATVRVRGGSPRAAARAKGPRCSCRTAGSASSSRPRSAVALRQEAGRRLRVIGAPDFPVVGDLMRKLGAVMSYQGDLAALLRAEHVAAIPLGPTWLRTGAGTPPIQLLVAALGYPVIPVAVRPGGPVRAAPAAVAGRRRGAAAGPGEPGLGGPAGRRGARRGRPRRRPAAARLPVGARPGGSGGHPPWCRVWRYGV